MKIGISTACTYPEHTENAVKYLCENGVSDIEIFFNSDCELEGKIFSEIEHIVKANGTRVISIHPFTSGFEPFMLFSDYDRRFADGLEFCKKYFAAANALGAKIMVLHGDRADRQNHDERYFERYHRLYKMAEREGVIVAQENVARCRSRELSFVQKMKKQLADDVAFVLDLKQARRSDVDVNELIDTMGEKIVHLHLNDYDSNHDCLLAGQGVCDFENIFKKLSEVGFKGDGVIEVYRQNFGKLSELIESYEYLNSLLKK